jgi:hypothetical protein
MARVAGIAWFSSWFGLYLEVFRHQHVALTGLFGAIWPSPLEGPQPGAFVRTVVVCSLVSPVVCALFCAWHRQGVTRRVGQATISRGSLWPAVLALFGIGLTLFGALNQVLRKPPVVIDLTLRTGNGGFVVLGALMAITGGICSYTSASRTAR